MLAARGATVTTTCSDDCDLILAIISAPLPVLMQAKRKRIPIIQRLDGVFYPAVAGRRWWALNLPIWMTYRFFSDWIIFQSKFSERSCRRFLGAPRCPVSWIYNGVDLNRFSPGKRVEKPGNELSLLCILSTFVRPSEIIPVLGAFDELRTERRDVRLSILGKFSPATRHIPETRPDVDWMGSILNESLPEIYRSADLMLNSKLRAPCPNVVLEAMASGLPIAGFESGAHGELIGNEAGICVSVDEDEFGTLPNLNPAPDELKRLRSLGYVR